ncbi:MAG: hypothetical protein NT082_04165 [Chloroflexi bacterium]|nr:hypothetical protein [Chloroflexota bacterium]
MIKLDFKKWSVRVILAVFFSLILFGTVFSVAPIYGVNITPQSTTGSANTGGWFGNLVPTVHNGYGSG